MKHLFSPKLLLPAALLIAIGCFVLLQGSHKAQAVTAADWRPGRIIDDAVFFNKDALTPDKIQEFLNSKVPLCDTYGTQSTSRWNSAAGRYYTRAEWGATVGNPAPYTCLKDYVENPTTQANNYRTPTAAVAGGISAAQIIWNAGQQYNINPEVLIVLLQKEQSLITDDWPYSGQYTAATGAYCPDSGPGGTANCDSTYGGFSKQILEAARLYDYYKRNISQFNFNIGSNYILWNVAPSGCGGGQVNIENIATAMLYIYTPYQPNQASLNNMLGQGDSCSAYGNRNFWRLFSDWFGTTYAPNYSWLLAGQQLYADSSYTQKIPWNNLVVGDKVYAKVIARNMGNTTWSNIGPNPIRIGTSRSTGHNSSFCDTNSWLSCARPTSMVEKTVLPGEYATFLFPIIPTATGSYAEYFNLVAEGLTWMDDWGVNYYGSINPRNYSYQLLKQAVYTDATMAMPVDMTHVVGGDKLYLSVQIKNLGNVVWTKNADHMIRLGTSSSQDRSSVFYDISWSGPTRPSGMAEATAGYGQTATFNFWINVPQNIPLTSYREYFKPVVEGESWLMDIGMHYLFNTSVPIYSYQISSVKAYTDTTKTAPKDMSSFQPNDTAFISYSLKNTGNTVWRKDGSYPVRMGASNPSDRISNFCTVVWISCGRPASLSETIVKPGETGTFEFAIKAPANLPVGLTREYFTPLIEGVSWMNSLGMHLIIARP